MKYNSIFAGLLFVFALCLVSCGGSSKREVPNDPYSKLQSLSESEVREVLYQAAQNSNAMCPLRYENGVVMESVTYESKVWQYTYLVQGEDFYIQDNDPSTKETIKASFRGNQEQQLLIRELIMTSSKMVYLYHTQGGKTFNLTFSTSELESFLD